MNPLQEAGSKAGIGLTDMLARYAEELAMADKPAPFLLPIVPLRGPTLSANVAIIGFNPGNGMIMLQIAEQRDSGVEKVGEKPIQAIFELGRFALTPRALRQLSDKIQDAIKKYGETIGAPLLTEDQFNARAAMTTLIPPPLQGEGKPPDET